MRARLSTKPSATRQVLGARGAAWMVAAAAVAAGCSSTGSSDSATTGDQLNAAITTTTEPSPFCRALGQLGELQGEPTSDENARANRVADIYAGLLDEVPATLRPDFEYVIATLRGLTPPTTEPPATDDGGSSTFDGEGYLTDVTPAERVGNYVNFACTGVENNPGPGPTEPP